MLIRPTSPPPLPRPPTKKKSSLPWILGIGGGLAALTLLGLLVVGLLVQFGYVPDTAVLPGSALSSHARRELRELGVINETETIVYFYSSGIYSVKEDGNFFTDTRVVSYAYNNDELWQAEARFEDIIDITFEKKGGFVEDSIITIFPREGEGFYLLVSNEDDQDEVFHAALETLWKKKRAPTGATSAR